MMYRLLIVDDEAHVVEWLSELFQELDDLSLDIYKAYSAKSALEWLDRTRMDIVITDISMPRMDGLELMKIIRSKWPECKIIFLTGFNEFDYAYEAIQNEAVGYILKTESDQVIVDTLKKAIGQIEETRRIEMLVHKSEEHWKQVLPLIKKEFATNLLSGLFKNERISQQQLNELEIPFSITKSVVLLLGRIDEAQDRAFWGKTSETCFHISFVVEKFLTDKAAIFFTPIDNSHMFWLFQLAAGNTCEASASEPSFSEEQLIVGIRDTLETIQGAVRESVKTSVSFALSGAPLEWSDISRMYSQLREMLNLSTNTEALVLDKSFNNPQPVNNEITSNKRRQILDKMESYLERGDRADFHNILKELAEDLKSIKSMHSVLALEIYYSISLMILSYINKRNLVENLAFKVGISRLTHIDEFRSWSEAKEYLLRISDAIFEIQSKQVNDMEEDAIIRIKHFIEEHLNEELSLVRLAEVVYFNPSYLSRFFKQMTGVNLMDYIFDLKVCKAKELLGKSSLKIHEVASSVGFDSSTYFARFFRRITGLNPQEYRDMILNGKGMSVK